MSKKQFIIVMRHGLRQDEVDPTFTRLALRPWDPPLAAEGLTEIAAASTCLQRFGIQKIVSSPYLRCLQTASIISNHLKPPVLAIEVDFSLGEVLGGYHLNGIEGPNPDQSVENWFWSGVEADEAITKALNSDVLSISFAGNPFAPIPEAMQDAYIRYSNAIETASNRAEGDNLLIITHGEGVGRSVTRICPWGVVHEVKHCGFTVASRELDEDGDWGLWELESATDSASHGVKWQDRAAALSNRAD